VLLLEIAAQGVRGFAPPGGRLVLRPGYNVVAGDGAVLRRLVVALFHPDHPADPSLRSNTAAGGAPARAGLTLAGDDGVTWRVVRDLAGPCQLQRFDPERRAFQSVAQDPVRIAEALRAAGVPAPERFAAVLSLSAADFPSRQAPSGLAAISQPAPRRSLGPEEARKKLEELRAEMERARNAEQVQMEMDTLQSRLFKLEEMLKSSDQVRDRLSAAEASMAGLAGAEAALSTLREPALRMAACRKATARRDEALQKIAQEREARAETGTAVPAPLWRHPGFLGGLGVGAASMVGALIADVRSLALVAIPATGWAAFEGLRWVGRAEGSETAGRRARWLEERERKAKETWERETADVRAVVAAAGVASVADLGDLLARVQEARTALSDAEAGMATWQARAETKDAVAERIQVEQEIGELEQKLTAETGGFVRDIHSLEVEIARLERELESPTADASPVEVRATPAPTGDPLRTLFERASADLALSPGAALRALQPRIAQILPALTVQRLANFFVDDRGNLQVQAGGKLVPAATLPPGDRDLCFAVLKLGFAEQGLAAGKSVAVLEDAFAVLPEGSRRVIARLLKQMAKGRQIVHATVDPIFREAADHAA
jgi:predicted  nucleic acid-binding Zn-ribbon protein